MNTTRPTAAAHRNGLRNALSLQRARDAGGERGLHYTNLGIMFRTLAMSLAVAVATGLCYWLLPRDWNWNSSQIALVLHLQAGLVIAFALPAFLWLHVRDEPQGARILLRPWLTRRDAHENVASVRQRLIGVLLTWSLGIVCLTGVVLALPGLLFYSGRIWMLGYTNAYWLGTVHLAATLACLPLLVVHMLSMRARGANREQRS